MPKYEIISPEDITDEEMKSVIAAINQLDADDKKQKKKKQEEEEEEMRRQWQYIQKSNQQHHNF